MKITNYLSIKSLIIILMLGLNYAPVYAAGSSVQGTITTVSVISDGVTYKQENVDFSDPEGVKKAIDAMVNAGAGSQESVTELFVQQAKALIAGTTLVYAPVKVSGGQVIPIVIDPRNSVLVAEVAETISDMGGSFSDFQAQLNSAQDTSDTGSLGEPTLDSSTSEQQVQGGGVDVSPQ